MGSQSVTHNVKKADRFVPMNTVPFFFFASYLCQISAFTISKLNLEFKPKWIEETPSICVTIQFETTEKKNRFFLTRKPWIKTKPNNRSNVSELISLCCFSSFRVENFA